MLRAAFLLALAAAAVSPPATDSAFLKENEEWRKKRDQRLRSDEGWLTLVGLHWLSPGENPFGSDPSAKVPLPPGKAPKACGVFVLEDGRVRLRAREGAGILLDGKPVTERVLATDMDEKPDVLHLGDLAFHVIRRDDRFAIRVKDHENPLRLAFRGIEYYPLDAAYRVVADWVPYPTPKAIDVPTVLGTVEKYQAPGEVRFRLRGREMTLQPVIEDPANPELFFIFKDGTSGRTTYPSGRFLYAAMPKEGKVVLDFNEAYNPPCAFTPFATCPLPPKQNWLPVRIEAGEKRYAHP